MNILMQMRRSLVGVDEELGKPDNILNELLLQLDK